MKNTIIITLLLLGTIQLSNAQIEPPTGKPVKETKTLLGKGSKIRGFGSVDLKVTDFKTKKLLLVGGHGGILLNNNFILGLGGYGITNNASFQGADPAEELYLYGGYGGLVIGAIIAPKEVLHVAFPVLIGAGGVDVSDNNYFNRRIIGSDVFREGSAFFVVEPGLDVEINITKFFKVGIGASYRLVSETDLDNLSDDDLSGLSAGLSFKLGGF